MSTPGRSPGKLDRIVATAVNLAEVARFGGLRVEADPAPYAVETRGPVHRLRHYFPDAETGRAPMLLVPPLMQVAEVWDISPSTSAVRHLNDNGIDPWVIDFGDPGNEPGGGQRTFSDHVLAVVEAIRTVRELTGQDVNIGGYSQGGVFCYVAAAYLASEGVASIFVLGSPIEPVDLEAWLPERLVWQILDAERMIVERTGLPRWAVTGMFNWSNPSRAIRNDLNFLLALHDRDSLMPREAQRQFLKRGAWIGWAGPAMADVIDLLSANRFADGGVVIGERLVGLADITCPILAFIGTNDEFATPEGVRRIATAAPMAEVYECELPVGHFGLTVSRFASSHTWPGIIAFVHRDREHPELPDYITRLHPGTAPENSERAPRHLLGSLTHGVGTAVLAGAEIPRNILDLGRSVAGSVAELGAEVVTTLPRLLQLERMAPDTRISYSKYLRDAARSRPDEVAFLYEDRAHGNKDADERVDRVVRGLLGEGVRRGQRVGLLMDMRPSALGALAAISRIGGVTVLLRPGDDVAHEIDLAGVDVVIADPDHAAMVLGLGVRVLVLGGGRKRELPTGLIDLERKDWESVPLPDWYSPDPGRARDLAYVLFTGRGENLRADEVTHGRWAASAITASAAAGLGRHDTIYSMSPLHHPSGLLLTTAAAVVSKARVALASSFHPDRFWEEVRRYGVTVVPYTWTMLDALVRAPTHAQESAHGIRVFIGSGMPPSLWRRVEQRFAPARVVELYASTRSQALLGNVGARKVGAMGRTLPGSAAVRVTRIDAHGRIAIGDDGFARAARTDEIGLLLVRASDGDDPSAVRTPVLRDLFATGDRWVATGDLFTVDAEGDFWLVDAATAVAYSDGDVISPRRVEVALETLPAVELAAARLQPGRTPKVIVAVRLASPEAFAAADLAAVFAHLPLAGWPEEIWVVDDIETTSWFRPVAPAKAPRSGPRRLRLSRRSRTYRPTDKPGRSSRSAS